MRILLLADVHGNRAALEAINETADAVLFLGDLVDYGPEPAACVEWVRKHADHAVRGNHDHGVAQNVDVQGVGGFRYLTACSRPFSVAALSSSQRRYLADLPTSRMLTLGGKRFLLVHATPRDPMDEYAPADRSFWGPRLGGLNVDYVCCGHTHQPYTLQVNSTLVINPGSVGLSRDGDPRAAYAIVDTDTGEVEMKRVDYPIHQTVEAVLSSNLPLTAKQMLADIYRGGAYLSQWVKKGLVSANGNGNGSVGGVKRQTAIAESASPSAQ